MNYLATSLAAVLFLGAASTTALAQTSISDSLGDAEQTITGDVTDVFGNRFVLDDGARRVLVDTGPDWYQQVDIREGDRVTVRGEAKRNHFDAYSITTADGQTIDIRSAEGPPPWAGGPDERSAERSGDNDWRGERTGSLREDDDGRGDDQWAERSRDDSRRYERRRANRYVPAPERERVESALERLGLQLTGRLRFDDNRIKGEARSAQGTNYEFELDRDNYEIVELDRD